MADRRDGSSSRGAPPPALHGARGKENARHPPLAPDAFAGSAGVKRRVGVDPSDDALLPDGFLLSQMDDDVGEGRSGVTWKSVSPPRHASNPTRAGDAMVNQLLRVGRGNAAAMEQARARSERRRVCEQLEATMGGSRGARATLPSAISEQSEATTGSARPPAASPNVEAAALLADVRALTWAEATPDGRGTLEGPGDLQRGRFSEGSVGRFDSPRVRFDSPRVRLSAAGPSRETAPEKETATETEKTDRSAPAVEAPFQCDWGDGELDDAGFDLAAIAAEAELKARQSRARSGADAAGALRAGSEPDRAGPLPVEKGDGARPTETRTPGPSSDALERRTSLSKEPPNGFALGSSDDALPPLALPEFGDAWIETEGAALSAWRVLNTRRLDDGALEVTARSCGGGSSAGSEPASLRTATLRDMWADSAVSPGDLIRVVRGANEAVDDSRAGGSRVDVSATNGALLVVHPGTLVNSTAVGGSMSCLRRTVLQATVPDGAGGDHAQAAVLGTLSHELSEASLFAAAFGTGPGAKGFFKHSEELVSESAARLFAAGTTEKQALDRLRYVGPGVHKWTRRLVKAQSGGGLLAASAPPPGVECEVLDGPGRRSRGCVALTKVVDAEETVWAPALGLRGVVDAVAVGKLEEEGGGGPREGGGKPRGVVTSGVVPVELKTGYWRSPVEHGAQLALYTLMLGERYRQRVPFGLLHYTRHPGGDARNKKDDETLAIRPGASDLAHLMHRRNQLAAMFAPAASREKASQRGGEPFALGTLPPMEQCASECDRCFVRDACFTVNAALEGGADAMRDPELADMARRVSGHLTEPLARELARWLRLVDLEAAATASRRATPWVPVDAVRRRGGAAADGFSLRKIERPPDAPAPDPRRPHLYRLEMERRSGEARSDGVTDGVTDGIAALRPSDRLVLSREGGAIVVGRAVLATASVFPSGEDPRRTSDEDHPPVGPRDEVSDLSASAAPARIVLEVETEREVRLTGPGSASEGAAWRVDRDDGGATMSGRARAALVSAFSSADAGARTLRRRLFELKPPAFDFTLADEALTSGLTPGGREIVAALNDEQRAAVRLALAAKDYALIAGLPGAGKSATLAALVRAFVDVGKSVLITSHTHGAVDNVLARLPGVGVEDYVRVGGELGKASAETAKHTPGGERHGAKTVAQLAHLADSARVVGATCYAVATEAVILRRRSGRRKRKGLGPEVPSEEHAHDASADGTLDGTLGNAAIPDGRFDVVLVDEAGQMTLPASVAPLLRGAAFVLVGDFHQLPPLVQSEAANAGGLGTSPMQRLAEAHPGAVAELRAQYRMADDLARISNVISYGGRLRAATREVAARAMRLPRPLPDTVPAWLAKASDPNRRVVFLDTIDLGARAHETAGSAKGKPTNAIERDVVLDVLAALVARGADAGACAVLSPYNSQVDAMAADLRREEARGALPAGAEALTIDRAQGRDVEAVVVSLVRANEARDAGRLLADRRRLNVAFTRAKSKLVIVGCGDTLRASPVLEQVMGVVIKHDWIVEVPRNYAGRGR
jgi:DNA replication ATP-dependent helicase Dna2